MTDAGSDRSTEALIVAASRLAASAPPSNKKRNKIIASVIGAAVVIGAAIVFAVARDSEKDAPPANSKVTSTTVQSLATGAEDEAPQSTPPEATTPEATTPEATTPEVTTLVTTATAATIAITSAVPIETTTVPASPVEPSPVETVLVETTAVPVADPAADPSTASNGAAITNPTNYGVYKEGVLYLVGSIESSEKAGLVRQKAELVLPPERIRGEFTIDPRAGGPSGIVRAEAGVLFDSGSAAVKPNFYDDLDLVVAVLTLEPVASVEIHGYTDSVGSDEANLALAAARVRSITDYLASKGIPRERFSGVPHGEANPVGDNRTASGRALNRRIDVIFVNLFN